MSDYMNLWLNYRATEDFFMEHLKLVEDKPFEVHFAYNNFIKLYSMHLIQPDAAEKLVAVCMKDIELFPTFKVAWHERNPTYGILPSIPSFKTLVMFYENKNRFYEAIDICNAALEYELTDGTKGGYSGRLARLERKLERQLKES
ncbi:hypothetical protein [Paenibacillus agri]|uniref:Tetratricopeptide repeat protein n=1 Tax=Paenibacillus agri TaxID=2744309 RepID=A0A850EXT1_9BACL|nr:hypothetical protein [Paenibacillus agri]NUU62651.1 hypothetical protein [Paenibacillus agri]